MVETKIFNLAEKIKRKKNFEIKEKCPLIIYFIIDSTKKIAEKVE